MRPTPFVTTYTAAHDNAAAATLTGAGVEAPLAHTQPCNTRSTQVGWGFPAVPNSGFRTTNQRSYSPPRFSEAILATMQKCE